MAGFLVCNTDDDTVTPIDAAGVAGTTIAVADTPWLIAITSDGATAYVTHLAGTAVTVIDVASGTVVATITVSDTTWGIAITPDDAKVYVTAVSTQAVAVIDTSTNTVTTTIPLGTSVQGIAITPDGTKAYVCNISENTVTPIDVATDTAGTPFAVGVNPTAVAFTPDSATAYVCNGNDDSVSPVDVATDTAGVPISVTHPSGVVFTPDGVKAYVASQDGAAVFPIDVGTATPGSPISTGSTAEFVAVTADGTQVDATVGSGVVVPIDVATDTAGAPITVGTNPQGIVYIPSLTPPVPNPDAMRVDAPIRTLITDMDSRTIAHFDRLATNRSWLFTLNGSAYHKGQVPSDNGEVNRPFPDADSPANLTNNRRLVFSLQRWPGATPPYQPIFGGILTIPEDQGTDAPTTTYTANDPWQLMMSRPIRDPDTGDLPGPDGITFAVGSRASDIALSFLAQTEAFDGESHIDSSDSGLIEATDPLPTEITFDEGTMVGEAWTQLTETGTIDIHLPPMYEPIDAPGKVVRFQTVRQADGVAAGPIRASAVMGWDRAGNSLAEINRLVDGTRMANTVQFYDENGNAVPVQTDPDSITANGVYYAQQFFPGANDTTLIALLAVAQLVIRRNGQRSIALSAAPERSVLPLRDYGLGDYVPVWASSNLREPLGVDYDTFDPDNPGASGYQRIYAIPLAADDNGVTTVTGLLTSKEN